MTPNDDGRTLKNFLVQPFTMSSNTEQIQNIEENPKLLEDFMSMLQRLFKICLYYPSGHIILDQATDKFLSLLVSLAGKKHFIRFEENGKCLLLQQVGLENSQPFVGEFRRLLASLSLVFIEISRDISREDLHDFIRKVIASRSQGSNIKRFSSVEITDLPPTIRVGRKEYLAREAAATDGRLDSAAENLKVFFNALAERGLTKEQINQCRQLLVSLPGKMKKQKFQPGDLPSASWEDIAHLLAQAIQGKTLINRSFSHGNLDMLSAILSSLEETTGDKKSREAINLIVSIIKGPNLEQVKGKDEEELQTSVPRMNSVPVSVSEIQDFVDKNRLNASSLQKIQDIPAEQETLSVLLQLIQRKQSLNNQARILLFFNDVFANPLQDRTWDILVNGLLAILRKDDRAVDLAMAIRLITESMRRSEYADPLELFLRVLTYCRDKEENILWPFAVNELLASGGRSSIDTFRPLCIRLARLSWKDMIRALPVLQSLDVFQQGQVAPSFFLELSPAWYPLCAFLLMTPVAPRIIGHVVDCLKTKPADKLIKAVAPFLDPSVPEHRTFLDRYFRHPVKNEMAEGLKGMAGDIITQGLNVLPQEMREQPWVAESISAMSDLQGNKSREILNQILTSKRLLMLPEWPNACRKAAQSALAEMKRRPKITRKSY